MNGREGTPFLPLDDGPLDTTQAHVFGRVVQAAVEGGQFPADDHDDGYPAALFIDTDRFSAECRALIDAFAAATTKTTTNNKREEEDRCLHAFAVKACPVVGVLRVAAATGMGGECASEGEVALCLAAGMSPTKIVLDAPCKTTGLLRRMLRLGVHVNADNVQELDRIATILDSDEFVTTPPPRLSVGLRLNPQIGSGTIGMTSTAGKACKFGVPLQDERSQILQAFTTENKYASFLTGIHIHVGSQGVSPMQLVHGVQAAVQMAEEINAACQEAGKPPQVTTMDIGGGLSVDYGGATPSEMIPFAEYTALLQQHVPQLFANGGGGGGRYKILTEFGRRLVAPCGFLATRVQTVKPTRTETYVMGYIGADLLLRAVYAPQQWRHAIHVYSTQTRTFKDGGNGNGTTAKFHVAGPLCFAGDIIAKERVLPANIEAQTDYLVLPMAGAYTISMYSRHTSQLVPAVYGYRGNSVAAAADDGAAVQFTTLKKAETLQDLVRFWGGEEDEA
eukprot:scaffold34662_cov176-Amphora_coffeaeformis.AAC.1